jgi:uncharacterized membrane protein HdeD (DUF308 family)
VNAFLLVGLLALSVGLALGALALARRRPEGGWWVDSGRASGVLGAARGPFAVILAFVILVAFQAFNDARRSAEEEATSTRNLFKVAELLEPNRREQMQENILCYSRAVVGIDWPAMRDGGSAQEVDDLGAELEDIVVIAHISGDAGAAEIEPILAEANSRDRERADRIAEGEDQIPGPVWIVLVLGTLSVLAYVVLFADRRERFLSQAVMVGSTTVILVGGLILVWFLSHPYEDEMGSIRPNAMERTLDELENDPEFAVPGQNAPCDSEGRALSAAERQPDPAD